MVRRVGVFNKATAAIGAIDLTAGVQVQKDPWVTKRAACAIAGNDILAGYDRFGGFLLCGRHGLTFDFYKEYR